MKGLFTGQVKNGQGRWDKAFAGYIHNPSLACSVCDYRKRQKLDNSFCAWNIKELFFMRLKTQNVSIQEGRQENQYREMTLNVQLLPLRYINIYYITIQQITKQTNDQYTSLLWCPERGVYGIILESQVTDNARSLWWATGCIFAQRSWIEKEVAEMLLAWAQAPRCYWFQFSAKA